MESLGYNIINFLVLQVIELDFLDFAMEIDRACSFDSLVVFDGEDTDAHALGHLCGADVPLPVLTHGNTATLVMTTDHSVTGKGFQITYTAVQMTCKLNKKASMILMEWDIDKSVALAQWFISGEIIFTTHASKWQSSLATWVRSQ